MISTKLLINVNYMNREIIKDAKKYVNKLLIPLDNYYYHSYEHAIDVMQRSVYLAEQEKLPVEDIEMMALAALFHDTGFIVKYDKNEWIGAHIAKNYLQSIGYDKERIDTIQRIILATDPEYKNPVDIYEKIIKDADMDNLGRDDFFKKAHDIKKELETIKKIKIKDPDWHHALVDLLLEHKFNTDTENKTRAKKKEENIRKVIEEMRKHQSSCKIEDKVLEQYLQFFCSQASVRNIGKDNYVGNDYYKYYLKH